MWSMRHRTIVVNTWRARINNCLKDTCLYCTTEIVESKFHWFGSALKHKEFGIGLLILSIIYKLDLVEMGLGRACPWNNVYLVLNLKVGLNIVAQFGISFKALPFALFDLGWEEWFNVQLKVMVSTPCWVLYVGPSLGLWQIGLEGGFAWILVWLLIWKGSYYLNLIGYGVFDMPLAIKVVRKLFGLSKGLDLWLLGEWNVVVS